MSSLLDAIKNKRQAIAAKSGRERPAKLTSAKNMVRVLPRWDGDENGVFFQDFGQHFIKDKAGNIQAVYICTATTFGRPCDVCAQIAEISATTTDEDMVKVLSEAKSSSRMLVNAIYMNGTHANAKTEPVLLELPVTVVNDILGIMETYLEDHDLNLISLKDGYDVVITKSGTGRDTKYTVTPSPKAREIPAETLSKARDLEAYAKQEYDAGLQKAIASLKAVTNGSLTGPSGAAYGTPANRPALSAPTGNAATLAGTAPIDMDSLEIDMAELDAVANAAAPTTPAPTPAPAAAPAVETVAAPSAPAANLSSELDELDALMREAGVAA
jgi:hypothetical protein